MFCLFCFCDCCITRTRYPALCLFQALKNQPAHHTIPASLTYCHRFSHFFFSHCRGTELFLRDPAAPAQTATPRTALFIRGQERLWCRVPPNSSKRFTMCTPPPTPTAFFFFTQLRFDPFVESEQMQIF